MGRSGRNAKEVERIVADFERSGLNRREYCERRGIARPTLDWYRRRVRTSGSSLNIVPVKIRKTPAKTVAPATTGSAADGFILMLGNGCRIEAGWNFSDDDMARLIRIAGAA
jgi:hypothetical protein